MGKSLSFMEAVNRVQEWKNHIQSLRSDSNRFEKQPFRFKWLPFNTHSKRY